VQCGENALKGVVAARGLGRDAKRLTADEWTSLASYLLNARTDADKWQVDPKECGAKLEAPSHLQRPDGSLTLTMLDRTGKTYSLGYEIHRIVVEVDTNDAVRVTTTPLCDVGDDL
jgi:hypothetical protein